MLAALSLLAVAAYMLVNVNFAKPKLFQYAMRLRTPKVLAMVITAFAIGGASIVFQSVIGNTIVTPCLLGMNALYTLIHTSIVFVAGSSSLLATNANAAFAVDLINMAVVATLIYGFLFQKTGHNVLYELGKTVILVLHEINYAAFYSDCICAFVGGRIAKYGTVKAVMTKENLRSICNVDFEMMEIQGKPLSIYY